jgi:hypothetical protein
LRYADMFNLPEPSDDIGNVLLHVAKRLNARVSGQYLHRSTDSEMHVLEGMHRC